MKVVIACLLLVVTSMATAQTSSTTHPSGWDDYQVGSDSKRQPDVPQGKTFQFKFENSKIFPGTVRTISVYVPAQYKADRPACVYVGLDGLGFDVPVVFDNLIARHEMPVTIAIGVSPGQVESVKTSADPRFNRSFEFDGLNDNLARFLLVEVFPEIEKNHKTADDLPIRLSTDPNDRCAGGGSTGGIGAFTLAWERPDAFRRVFTAIGTFVGMRGGDRYPVLIRKTEPKPIRVFMQDGSADEWMGGPEVGDWWMSNQTVERALDFAGYDVQHIWGTGPHSGRQATAIFPDVMRFLWKDWPQPIKAGQSRNTFLKAILDPARQWEQPIANDRKILDISCNSSGELCALPDGAGQIWKYSGPQATILGDCHGLHFAFGPGDRICVAHEPQGAGLFVTHNGMTYATVSGTNDSNGKLWLIDPKGEKTLLDGALNSPTAVAVSLSMACGLPCSRPTRIGATAIESKTTAASPTGRSSTGFTFPTPPTTAARRPRASTAMAGCM